MKHRPKKTPKRQPKGNSETRERIPRVALIGAGDRGTVYTDWIASHQDTASRRRGFTRRNASSSNRTALSLVAVAEPNETRRTRLAARHGLDESRTFTDWQTLFDRVSPHDLDGVIVATGDREHVEPACAALERGHHILLEKPMATDAQGLRRLRAAEANSPGGSITVCHVLRHSEVFRTIKLCIDAGEIGDVMTIYHAENVSYYHMAHSFVRGRWRNSAESSPMILAKSCHDLDLMCWFAGSRPVWVASTSERSLFRSENAPAGAPERCTDGCPVADSCPFEAVSTYRDGVPIKRALKRQGGARGAAAACILASPKLIGSLPGLRRYRVWPLWPTSTITDDPSESGIMRALEAGPYGRCVYRCDNDQPDHQETIVRFASGATASFRMHGHSHDEGRTLRIDGTRGTIRATFGGTSSVELDTHGEDHARELPVPSEPFGHAGADSALMAAWSSRLHGELQPSSSGGRANASVRKSAEEPANASAHEPAAPPAGEPAAPPAGEPAAFSSSGPAAPPSGDSALVSHIAALAAAESSRTGTAIDLTRWTSENGLTGLTR